ncbi:unnamed protein product [Penicillium salamii]|uniref:Enoyl reductase (ER) domain-containing protein n=1 Tax=Penicillium salamii TaxID=1612424 RepID=A0A9W4JHF9_9EURO|nr:unnamed protein product [Penicillium salamii]
MGGSLSRIWSLLWSKKEIRILILGLIGEVVTTIPTIGFNVESVTYKNLNLNVWDLGGQTSIRPYWRCYYANTAAVVFVIDSTDIERLGTAADELAAMLSEEELSDAALLVFANKQDQPGAKGAGEISEALKLGELRDRNWSIVACSAIDGKGINEGMDWLVFCVLCLSSEVGPRICYHLNSLGTSPLAFILESRNPKSSTADLVLCSKLEMTVPQIQTAAVVASAPDSSSVVIKSDHPVPSPGEGEILVKLEFSGVCHSDLHSIRGDTPMLTDVAGHEGVGKVVKGLIGVEMWLYSSCRQCEICEINHTACPNQKNAGAYIVSPALHVTKIPEQLSPDSAAPLLCAGIAMYSSIMKTQSRPGDYLAIIGAGGGLGHMYVDGLYCQYLLNLSRRGIQIATKKGLRVIAIDSGEKKRQLCLSLGAIEFLDYREVDIVQATKAKTRLGVHAVICTANGERAYEQSMQMLRPLGTLVCVGIPSVPFRLPATPFDMIVKGLTIVGNSAGTADEMDELLAMAVTGDVEAHIDVFELHEINAVLDRLERSDIDGRVVLRIPE